MFFPVERHTYVDYRPDIFRRVSKKLFHIVNLSARPSVRVIVNRVVTGPAGMTGQNLAGLSRQAHSHSAERTS